MEAAQPSHTALAAADLNIILLSGKYFWSLLQPLATSQHALLTISGEAFLQQVTDKGWYVLPSAVVS